MTRRSRSDKTIVFDFDGTLADTMPGIAAALSAGLPECGLPAPDPAGIPDNIGRGLRQLCRWAAGDPDDGLLNQVVAQVRAAYRETWRGKTTVFPGIPDVLDVLKRQEYNLAVLSNKAHDFTVAMAESLFPRGLFDHVVGISDHTRPKPDPGGLLEIIKCVGASPEKAALVGDMSIDVRTGAACGVRVIGVTWGFQGGSAFKRYSPWRVALTPKDILRFTERLLGHL